MPKPKAKSKPKKKAPKKKALLTIQAQMVGFKNLKIAGGWRLELDLFESKLREILAVTALVNDQASVKITVELNE